MKAVKTMKEGVRTLYIGSWIFGIIVVAIGLLNLFLIHPVPGIAYLLLSFLYFPPAHTLIWKRVGFPVELGVKVILAIIVVMFTLGVSDLGDMID
jgi:hypothetical protein